MKLKYNIIKALTALCLSLCLCVSAAAYGDSLVPVGQTIGIDLRFGGVMVAELTDVGDLPSPAAQGGLQKGDIITHLDDMKVRCASDFVDAAEDFDGGDINLSVRRGGEEFTVTVTPQKGDDGVYRLGLWLRDGVSGIGTVTFYDPETGLYGALGHAINDLETGQVLPCEEGEVCRSSVQSVVKGEQGCPGELCGEFEKSEILGTISSNTPSGIFGQMTNVPEGEALQWASEEEIALGDAVIYANVNGTEVQEFTAEICRIYHDDADNRDFLLAITDSALLEKTGGIVQGMSGSPVIQNGKIVGAVTHVLINDPTRGYGIFIENMLEAAE